MPTRSPSTGARPRRPLARAPQAAQVRRWRAIRLRQSGEGRPSQGATVSVSSGHGGSASRARTTERPVSRRSFMRWTRTAACCGVTPRPSASSARVSSPAASSHHRARSSVSSSSSQRVARATSRRCPERPRRRMVSSVKSPAGSARSAARSRPGTGPRRCSCQRRRIPFMAMATSQDRKRDGSRRAGSPSRARTIVSWTMSSVSAWPSRARPTMLWTSGRCSRTRASLASASPALAASTRAVVRRSSLCMGLLPHPWSESPVTGDPWAWEG
ncbi:hypothetical protein STANM309S_01195 [Streptomyces tanashiensis]